MRSLMRDIRDTLSLISLMVMVYVWFGVIVPALMGVQP